MKKVRKLLSILAAVSIILPAVPKAFAEDTQILYYEQSFDEETLPSDWSLGGTQDVQIENYVSVSDKVYHSGGRSLEVKDGPWEKEAYAVYSGEEALGAKVYAFWYYDPSAIQGSSVYAELTGLKEDGTPIDQRAMFGVKTGAYGGTYIGGDTYGTGVSRTKGWHFIVMDAASNAGRLTIYMDGKITNVNQRSLREMTTITGIRFMHKFNSATGEKFYFDDLKVYDNIDMVPLHMSNVVSDMKFESGVNVSGASDVVLSDGDIVIGFSQNMAVPTKDNFTLLKKSADSLSDADYTAANITLKDADSTHVTLSVDNIEADTVYRLEFNGLETEEAKNVEPDFISFTTYDDLNWDRTTPKGLIYTENFDENLDDWIVSNSEYAYLSDNRYHTGTKSLAINNMSESKVSYNAETEMGNYVYSFWFYDPKLNDGKTLVDLVGVDSEGSSVTQRSMFGIKYPAYGNYYIGANTNTTGVERTVGWHYVVMDASDAGKLTIYVDGKVTNINNYTSGQPAKVTGIEIFHAWDNHGVIVNVDDLRVYKNYENVPVYRTEMIDSITFDDMSNVENAEGVIKNNGNINIKFKKEMSQPTEENFVLLSRNSDSVTDADFIPVAFDLISSNSNTAVIAIDDLQADKEYRLVMNGMRAADETAMADDFIAFKTAYNVELEDSVVEKIAFSNGARIPSVGIPETFGDLIVHFAMDMNTQTLNKDTIILAKEDGTVIDYIANASATEYTINSSSIDLEPSTTYTLTVTQDAETANDNFAKEDYTASFTTSSDLAHQEPIVNEGFEDGAVNWTLGSQMYLNTDSTYAHSGNNSLKAVNGKAEYSGSVHPNAVYELWLYDTGNVNDAMLLSLAGVDANGNNVSVQLGAKNGYGDNYFIMSDLSTGFTVGKRSAGWHRLMIDFTDPEKTKYYIDDEMVYERAEKMVAVKTISVENPWQWPTMYVDDVKIWNVIDYDVISRIEENKAFICDENYNRIVDYNMGDDVYIAVNVNNQQPQNQSVVLAVGEYSNGNLSRVLTSDNIVIPYGESANVSVAYTIPDNFENIELKTFVWDSLDTMRPIMPASNPKEITAVFLGGSITQGTGATSDEKCYVSLVGNYLKQAYGEELVTIVNSGVGGKGSDYGSEHFASDVAAYSPDILFVEYAVNDRIRQDTDGVKATMEEIVQKSLALPKTPNIVFIYTTTYQLDACTALHQEVADYYQIESVDLQTALENKVNQDILEDPSIENTWKANGMPYLGDGVHPTDLGYQFYADKIIEALQNGALKAPQRLSENF